ncbi:MAG: hypothetical protein HOP17_14340, partial [Acidobacteria bacterium]|nr:hypothetical protein [Acidobacteriota bacterium]
MDQLNQYLEQLVSTAGYELHLIPNTNPYLVSASGNTDLDAVPLQGSQISMMVFPLIPNDVKQELPNQPLVQFVHPNNLGEFNFTVQKSAAGFNVTIKPVLGSKPVTDTDQPLLEPSSIDIPANSFPAIDLQPVGNSADSSHDFPEFEVEV